MARTLTQVREPNHLLRVGSAEVASVRLLVLAGCSLLLAWSSPAHAFRIHDAADPLSASAPVYLRWDAAPREVLGEERSLDGGLRYSLEGGSYEAFRDQLVWNTLPTGAELRSAVHAAFAAWTVTDPATGLGTSLSFVEDLATEVWDNTGDLNNFGTFVGANFGAEIDLIVETTHRDPGYLASVIFSVELPSFHDITLTSGTTDYAGLAITGADIHINPIYSWGLEDFQLVLTHEIGHALGFADAEVFPGAQGLFTPWFDDDFDGTDSATALATLTNSFALEIDPFDPDGTPLVQVPSDLNTDPGLDTFGVDILMESEIPFGLALADPVLQNDDFAGRQFLYPVPEPGLALLLGLAAAALPALRRGR
jgi:hypothetical protein